MGTVEWGWQCKGLETGDEGGYAKDGGGTTESETLPLVDLSLIPGPSLCAMSWFVMIGVGRS